MFIQEHKSTLVWHKKNHCIVNVLQGAIQLKGRKKKRKEVHKNNKLMWKSMGFLDA